MRSLTLALFVTAGFMLSACHPGSPPAPSGTVKGVAAAIEAGSAPADSAATAQGEAAPATAAANANTASAAIAAQTASGASSSVRKP